MTKLEELTVLLVNEINDFNKGIEKLEKINAELNNTKIEIDLKDFKSIFEVHRQEMISHLESISRFERRFSNQIIKAKIYPNWAVIVFVICLLLGVSSVSYVFINYFL